MTSRRSPWPADLVLALGVAVAASALVWALLQSSWWMPMYPQTYFWAIAALTIALALRRRAPRAGFWCTLALSVLTQRAGLMSFFHVLPIAVATFAVVRSGAYSWMKAIVPAMVAGAMFFVVGLVDLYAGPQALWLWIWEVDSYVPGASWGGATFLPNFSHLLQVEAIIVGAVVLGHVLHRLALTQAELEARHEALVALQHAEADRAVTAERNRISRELHDVVAHHVTAIVVRAQAAAHVSADRPEVAPEALRWIAKEGKEALTATRSMVHILQADAGAAGALMAPGDLVAELRRTAERIAGERRVVVDLPEVGPAVGRDTELALVRIAQEAMTNVVLHSRADVVGLVLVPTGSGVRLEITDPGPTLTPTVPVPLGTRLGGNGLVHMRERAAAVGGRLEAGPDGEGWRVSAEVPISVAAAGELP